MKRWRSRLLVSSVAVTVLAAVFPGAAEAQSTWQQCFSKVRPGVSQLGGPLIPGAKLDVSGTATQFKFYFSGGRRTYFYDTANPDPVAWYLERYPYKGGFSFAIPSVKSGTVSLDCGADPCEISYGFSDGGGRSDAVTCPPAVGQNVVNSSLIPKARTFSDSAKCAGFTGNFMTTWGPMRLDGGNGTYTFRTKTDNTISGTVTATATGWNLDGRWSDLQGSGNLHFEMDRATGNFFGNYQKGDVSANYRVSRKSSEWMGQCRATFPTTLSVRDDQFSRDAVTNSPPIGATQENAGDIALPAPGTFTPLDPASVPCGGFNGKMWSSAFGDIVLVNGTGTYKFGRDPEASFSGTVTPTPTGWVLTGTYGSGATGGTIRLEQDNKGSFAGRYKGSTAGSGAVAGSCTPG